MKQSLITLLLLGSLGLLMALSSIGMSPIFTIDTVEPVLEIAHPLGGEIFYIGDSQDIQWTATDTNLITESINIEYSASGSTFNPLAEGIFNSGTYTWEIPSSPATNAKIRISASDTFGNTSIKTTNPFAISYVPPAIPTGINVEITAGNHAIVTWQAVDHTIPPYNTPITPDGYIVLYNESAYEHDENFYYFLGRSYTTTYTHHDVAEFRDQMFYRVIAYKNLRADEEAALVSLERESTERPITWQEAKKIMKGAAK